jgi:hypothetical protein
MASEEAIRLVPTSVLVGPYTYAISFDVDASYDYGYLGAALYRSRRIKLDPRQADTELPQTLLHEVIYALGNAYEIEAWDRHTTDDKQKITDKIDLMATAMLQFIRTNPDLVDWLRSAR